MNNQTELERLKAVQDAADAASEAARAAAWKAAREVDAAWDAYAEARDAEGEK